MRSRDVSRRELFIDLALKTAKVGGLAVLLQNTPVYQLAKMLGVKSEHLPLVIRDMGLQEAEAATLPLNYVSREFLVPTGADCRDGIAALSQNATVLGDGITSGVDNTDASLIKNGGSTNIKITMAFGTSQTKHQVTWPITIVMDTSPTIGFRVYHDVGVDALEYYWSSNAVASDSFRFNPTRNYPNMDTSFPRWRFYQWHRDEWDVASGSASWLADMRRIVVTGIIDGGSMVYYLDQNYYDGYQHPVIPWIFEGGSDTHYSTVFGAGAAKLLTGTLAFPTDVLDTSNKLTTAQVDEMYAAGWDVIHMSNTATSLVGLTVQQVVDRLGAAETVMQSKGWTRTLKHTVQTDSNNGTIGLSDANMRTAYSQMGYLSAVDKWADGTDGANATNGLSIDPIYGISLDPYRVPAWRAHAADTITEHQFHVRHAVKAGGPRLLRTAAIGAAGGELSSANHSTLLNEIALKHHAGTLSCLPYRKFYSGLSGRKVRA